MIEYTQHSVAFPTIAADPARPWVYDQVMVSGERGEFGWSFMTFDRGSFGVQVSVFGDGLETFYDPRVQRVVRQWRDLREANDSDGLAPELLIEWLEAEGIGPSEYHRSPRTYSGRWGAS